jgi:translation elongation factor aEF-1 beta
VTTVRLLQRNTNAKNAALADREKMSKMVLIYRISPQGTEEIKKIEERLPEKIKGFGELKEIRREPIAFGMEVIKIAVVVEAKGTEGITEKIENEIKKIEGVNSVENTGMNLL